MLLTAIQIRTLRYISIRYKDDFHILNNTLCKKKRKLVILIANIHLALYKLFRKYFLKRVQKIDQLALLVRKRTEDRQNITTPPIFLCVWILIFIKHRNHTALSFAITKHKLLKCLKNGITQAYDTLFWKTKTKHGNTLQQFSKIRLWNETLWKEKYIVQEASKSLHFSCLV